MKGTQGTRAPMELWMHHDTLDVESFRSLWRMPQVDFCDLENTERQGYVAAPAAGRPPLITKVVSEEYIRTQKAPSLVGFSNVVTNMPKRTIHLPATSEAVVLPIIPYAQFMLPPTEATKVLAPDTYKLTSSCGVKIITGAVMGSVVGVAMGIFLGAMGDNTLQVAQGKEVPSPPLKELMRASFKSTMAKTRGLALTFGVLTALFEGSECVVERYRSKHDVWNQIISGCFSGATLSAKAGPGAACLGCVGFASFSIIIEKIMGPH